MRGDEGSEIRMVKGGLSPLIVVKPQRAVHLRQICWLRSVDYTQVDVHHLEI